MPIPVSSSQFSIEASTFLREGFELSLDTIVPSIVLTGSYSPTESKTQFYIYDYAKNLVHSNLDYNSLGSYLPPTPGTTTNTNILNYNQFELNPTEDIYNQGFANGKYYAVYNFIDYELDSQLKEVDSVPTGGDLSNIKITYSGHPYFLKDISGDRREIRIQNNFLNSTQIENAYNTFTSKLEARNDADEFYVSFPGNRNFIGVNTQLELPTYGDGSIIATSILIKLYKPLPKEFEVEQQLQIISKTGETQAFEVNYQPNLEFIDNLLTLKGPNYNIDIKDRINNSTEFKTLDDLVNTKTSSSYYQLNSLKDQKGVVLRKNWADWSQFVKYSSAEQRLNNFYSKMVSIESASAELELLETITDSTTASADFSSSYNLVSDNINQLITKFDSYEYFLYYITGSESWPKYNSDTYPYNNYSITSSQVLNWFGSTNEISAYYNSGKNQIYSASRYDNDNQDYLYYLIPPFITDNSSNDQYKSFVNMAGQSFDEMYLYTEAVEQVRNTNSGLTGSVLPLGLADEVITSLGFDTYANDFNSVGFNPNSVGVFPATGSGLEYITRYIDIASGSVINYYDQQESTLGYVISLADPSFPYPLNNSAQEIYKRIFHNMISLVKRKGTVTGLRQLINIWGVPNTMLRISEFGGKNKDDENDYDLWMNRYSTALTTYPSSNAFEGQQATVTMTFSGTGAGFSGGINFCKALITVLDINGVLRSETYSITTSPSDQDTDIGGGIIGVYQGAGKTPTEKAANFLQAINSSVSTIKSYITATVDGAGSITFRTINSGTLNNSNGGYAAFANWGPLISTPNTSTFSGGINGTLNTPSSPSGSIRIPWQPLTSNYYADNQYAVPDCIQFRFKSDEAITATSNFSQSLLVKGNLYSGYADFGITLAYSGSQSGSWSGAILPTDNQYGELTFFISGSTLQQRTVVSDPISLPFFNKGWWSVQLQRNTHIAMTGQDGVNQVWELKVANSIYDGYDGNQIGFTGSATISKTSVNNTYNEAWNNTHGVTALSPSANSFAKGYSAVALGGMMQSASAPNQFSGTTITDQVNRLNIGNGFSGSFQEFRYYRRAMSGSQFNDYVMNPESIQGHGDANTGLGSSYDLLSFRLPLGNELEYTEVSGSANGVDWNNAQGGQVKFLSFGGNSFFAGENAFGSLHPSLVNKLGSLFTSSFITTANVTSSQYGIAYQGRDSSYTNAQTASYLVPNTELNYMDQPAAGIRNRIKNKINIIDGNEYGTTLSPFRSIQQEFEQSGSYTEDINSLEVAFSFQNEINDDIIATFGHGVVSDAIADPRFISESSDRYPELTRIAEDYFKKYQGVTVDDPTYIERPNIVEKEYDYNRLIKFYETSLFKAIKNYVPARTSLSTGIVVKQHLLERNKTDAVIGMTIDTPIAKTPETGSDSWGYTTQTGFNSVISNKNLLITSSIAVGFLTGSAGGSVNKYNVITNEGQYYQSENSNVPSVSPNTFVNLFPDLNPSSGQTENNIFLNRDSNGEIYLESAVAFRSQMRFNPYLSVAPASPGVNFTIQITSSERGGIFTNTFPTQPSVNPPSLLSENYVDVYPNERLYVYIACDVLDTGGNNIVIDGFSFEIGEGNNFDKPEPKVSQQVNWYIDDFTGENKVKDTQEEFYNGEYSGSNIPVELNEYNPYRIFADGNDGVGSVGPKHFYERDSFTIIPTSSFLFQNSPYNPIINNVSGSRKNSYLFDQDFNPSSPNQTLIEGIPTDYSLLVSSSQLGWEGVATADNLLEYSEVPDSNYTITSIINPRYIGSKITSADYNFGITQASLSESKVPTGVYSPLIEIATQKASKIRFLNGETGSWEGDSTGPYLSAIETRPINFAHFKTSYESLEIKDSTTFEIDYLVQIPFTSIQGEQAPIITGSILTSNNDNLIPVSSTFVPNRKLKAYYNNATKQFRNFQFFQTPSLSTTTSPILNYGAEKPESKYILFPSQEIISEFTNQKADIEVSLTSSFNIPLWMASSSVNYTKTIGGVDNRWDINSTRNGFISGDMNTNLFNLSQSIVPAPLNERSGSITLAVTGSSPSGDREGYGLLYLQGYATQGQNIIRIIPANPNLAQELYPLSGPHLAMINSLNINIDRGDLSDTESPNYNDSNPNQNAQYFSLANVGFPIVASTGDLVVNPGVGPSVGNYKTPLPVLPTLSRVGGKGFANYFSFNYSSSALTEYQNKKIPLMVERGDEIQVTYASVIGTNFRPVDGSPNTLGNYRYDTVNFTVLGYEQPPPNLLILKENVYPLTDGSKSPWYAQNNGTQIPFWAIIDNLTEKGTFSPDELVDKFNVMSYNSQSLFAANTNSGLATTWSGSIISAVVESRIGETSGSSAVIATTGSIKLYLTGSRVIAPQSNEVNVALFSDTLTLRATNYGNNEGGEDLITITKAAPSKYQYANITSLPIDPGFVFDTLKVTPNPATLPTPILSGSIMSMTIKKRLDNDMRVVVDMSQPDGNKGVLTPSGDGYLIPDDLTVIQQDNVVKLINVLKSQNAFTNPPSANETSDVS